jgi:hypothetical protein
MSVRSLHIWYSLLIKKNKGTRCNKSGIGLVKVVEAFVTNRSRVC